MSLIAVLDENLTAKKGKDCYVIADQFTGEVVDDSNGCGYRNAERAWNSYHHKQTDEFHQEDDERNRNRAEARVWTASHPALYDVLDRQAEWAEQEGRPDMKPDRELVKQIMQWMWPDEEVDAAALFHNWSKDRESAQAAAEIWG